MTQLCCLNLLESIDDFLKGCYGLCEMTLLNGLCFTNHYVLHCMTKWEKNKDYDMWYLCLFMMNLYRFAIETFWFSGNLGEMGGVDYWNGWGWLKWVDICPVTFIVLVGDFILLVISNIYHSYNEINGLVHDCGNSGALALELPQFCTETSKYSMQIW